ncbi:MAG: PAS domain S-box protein, partial [Dehalococcoidia bacterium]|nr:PAS domain S-box protein [Dehalococcoidia bacterium]
VSKRAEEALRESEERFRKAFQSSPVGIIMTRLSDNHMVDVNDTLLRMWGYTREEVVGRTAEDLNVWVNPEDRLNIVQALRENKPVSMFEAQFRRKSGELAWGVLSATHVDIGGEPHLIVLTQDVTERKRTEEALRAANETMFTLVTASPSAIICIDMEGRATVWNRAAERIFGWTAQEIIGKPLPMTPPEKAEEVKALRQRALQGETVTGYEVRRLRKDGSLIDVSVSFGPVCDPQGRVTGIVSVMTDITRRKRTEEKLRMANETVRTLVTASPSAIITVDLEGRATAWNHAAERIFGWTAHEVIGKPLPMTPPEKAEEVKALRQQALRGETVTGYVGKRLRKDGSLVDVNVAVGPIHDQQGRVVGTIGVMTDISARKRAEAKLTRTTAQLNALIQSSPTAILVIDKESRVTEWSPAAERMYGWSAQEIIGMPLPLIPEDRREEHEVMRQRSLGGEPLVDYETRRLRKDGSQVDVSVSTALLRNAEGEIVGRLGIHLDITARKRVEQSARQSAERIRQGLYDTAEAIGRMSEGRDPYTAGHEKRVAHLCVAIAVELDLSAKRVEGLRIAAAMHDLGKFSVPAEILNKPGKLTNIEMSLIKTHPETGYEILKEIKFPWPVADIVCQHHELMDGSGYPRGLKDQDILLETRILTVADVVEAMASHRPYRPAHALEKALEEITNGRGTKYDARAVDACLKLLREKGYKLE